jgi:predicted lysophospholipase L1 biosynthesis ABC-type transport system permease subunit
LSWTLKQKWFWMLFILLTAMLIVPFVLIWVIISLSPSLFVVVLVVAATAWVILRAYKNWVANKSKEGEKRQQSDCP